MKPCSYSAKPASVFIQILPIGKVIGKIGGRVKRLGESYSNTTVVLFHKDNLQPIATRVPDPRGNYSFLGLNTDLKTFIVAFDQKQQFNAVIQDNVVPK